MRKWEGNNEKAGMKKEKEEREYEKALRKDYVKGDTGKWGKSEKSGKVKRESREKNKRKWEGSNGLQSKWKIQHGVVKASEAHEPLSDILYQYYERQGNVLLYCKSEYS